MDGHFWKNNTKPIPGQVCRQQEVKSTFQARIKSYQYYQESVNDAWDMSDADFSTKSVPKGDLCYIKTVQDSGSVSSVPSVSRTDVQNHQEEAVDKNSSDSANLRKTVKLKALLDCSSPDFANVQNLSWSGVPANLRPDVWRLLSGYVPSSKERRLEVLQRKRKEYWDLVSQYFNSESRGPHQKTYRQIQIDIPRMAPVMNIFQQKSVQQIFERVLFIWAIRHPATSYVQGMNDLVTPFFVVFLQEFLSPSTELSSLKVDSIEKDFRDRVEADSFWCFCNLMDGIQDNYVFAQIGIQEKVNQLRELIRRVDRDLHEQLERHGVDYLQFCFRWMNNLLTREVPFSCSLRLWDTYLAERDNIATFLVYICAAFLLHWKVKILSERDFQGLIIFLQNPPTKNWTEVDIAIIAAEAYKLKFTFADALKNLTNN